MATIIPVRWRAKSEDLTHPDHDAQMISGPNHPMSVDFGQLHPRPDENKSNIMDSVQSTFIDQVKSQFFYMGLSFGASLQMFLVTFLIMFVSASNGAGPIQELSHEYYTVFRSIFFIVFFFSLYGINLFIWKRAHIDYARVLGVTYRHTYQFVLRGSSAVAYLTFTMFMFFVLTITGCLTTNEEDMHVLKHVWPACSIFIPLVIFLCPWDWFTQYCFGVVRNGFSQRYYLLQEVGAVLISPMSKVTFLRVFIADIFCSMPKIFTDVQYSTCLYLTMTFWDQQDEWKHDLHIHGYDTCGRGSRVYFVLQMFLGFLPYVIRLLQTLRAYVDTKNKTNLFNSIKYSLSLATIALAAFPRHRLLYVIVGAVATAYSFYWDVFMDWGLGNLSSTNWFLRDTIHFKPNVYYMAIVLDLLMRLGWALYIPPVQPYVQQHFILMLGCVELIRRFVWAIFRVEWEHTKLLADTSKKNKLFITYADFPTHKVHGSSTLPEYRSIVDEEDKEEMMLSDPSDGKKSSNSAHPLLHHHQLASSSSSLTSLAALSSSCQAAVAVAVAGYQGLGQGPLGLGSSRCSSRSESVNDLTMHYQQHHN